MPLIKLSNASLAFGHVALLDKVDLQIEPGERVCLVGRNGEGKSTLLRVLNGDIALDGGSGRGSDTGADPLDRPDFGLAKGNRR